MSLLPPPGCCGWWELVTELSPLPLTPDHMPRLSIAVCLRGPLKEATSTPSHLPFPKMSPNPASSFFSITSSLPSLPVRLAAQDPYSHVLNVTTFADKPQSPSLPSSSIVRSAIMECVQIRRD